MKLECTSLSRLKSARAERSKNRGAQSATKLCGAAARSERTCIAPILRAIRARGTPARAAPGGRAGRRRSAPLGHLLQTGPAAPAPDMATPRPAELCPDPRPLLGAGPGPLAPHLPGRTAGLGNQLQRASERARRRARVGGAASKPKSPESECRGGREAAAIERSFLRLLSRPRPRARATHPLPTSGAESKSPESPLQPCTRWIAREAASGAPEWYALGPGRRRRWRRTGFQGPSRAGGLPPALGPALPQLCPMGSFIPYSALDKYLPSAHRVPSTGTIAEGMRREESVPALPSWDSQLGQGRRSEPTHGVGLRWEKESWGEARE